MSAVRVVVVDDEPLARERIVQLVRETDGLELIGEAANGIEALDLIAASSPDLLFLDVEMPELTGFDLVSALDDARIPGLIFVTAYEEYAMRAFEVDAIDYLQKPVTPERFAIAVRRALGRLGQGNDARGHAVREAALRARERGMYRTRFAVRRGSTHTFVSVSDVSWIDAVDNYLRLHVGTRVHLVRGTMKEVERELDPSSFVRIHRGAIVSIARITAVETQAAGGYVVRLADGTRLRTSRQYAAAVRSLVAHGTW
ncbi:MAG TPA: LytTR family DNA-binding domain-containing protein [Gemmatimonadaceae bacterium]|nr:LytTR family DNA-binding domain-containing protein [Gemmatimonadaceae bacterium]